MPVLLIYHRFLPQGSSSTHLPLLILPQVQLVVETTKIHGLERKQRSDPWLHVQKGSKEESVGSQSNRVGKLSSGSGTSIYG